MQSTAHLRLVPQDTTAPGGDRSADLALSRLTIEDLEAAERLAELHRALVAQLPLDSEVRALALRAGGHWDRLAGLPRRRLDRRHHGAA